MPTKDPYAVLGVPRNADEDTIKKAFRREAKKWHPDKHGGAATAEQKFKEINEAYQTLTAPAKALHMTTGPAQPSAYQNMDQAAAAVIEGYVRIIKTFNDYALFVRNASHYRAHCIQRHKSRHPGLSNVFRRYSLSPEQKIADQLLTSLARTESAAKVDQQVRNLRVELMTMNPQNLPAMIKKINEVQQQLDRRIDAIQVLGGENVRLRYKPK